MTEAQKIEKLEAAIGMLLLAFPDETISDGKRLRLNEVRRLNAAVAAGKEYLALRNQPA